MMRSLIISAATIMLAMTKPNPATAQVSKEFVGTWALVSAVTEKEGVKSDIFGAHAKGMLVFDATGNYMLTLIAGDLPKFASNNRATGTADENKVVIGGSLAHFGTYAVNDAEKSFTFRVERVTFPNWEGAELKRSFVITADELIYTDPRASAGGFATVVWKRVK